MSERARGMTLIASAGLGIAALLAACSGGAGTTVPQGTTVTVDVVDTAGQPVNGQAGFQTGDDAWQSLVPTAVGTYEFLVPDGESAYGFAVNCPSGLQGSSTKAIVFQLTVEEATQARATCPVAFVGSATTVGGSFDATAVGADGVSFYTAFDNEYSGSGVPSGTYGPVTIATGSGRTLVAVAENATFDAVGVKVVRNLSLSSAATVPVTFAAGDAVGSAMTPDFSSTVPAGFDPNLQLAFVADQSQFVTLDSESSAAAASVPTVPNTQAGDLYLVIAAANDPGSNLTYASLQFQDSLTGLAVELPDPWTTTPSIVGGTLPTFTGLSALPNEPGFRGHVLVFAWDGIPDMTGTPALGATGLIQAFVSTGWRGASTSYEVPDLTTLPGFGGAKALSGESGTWISGGVASSLDTETLVSEGAFPFGFGTGIYTPLFPPRTEGVVNRIGLDQGTFTIP